MRSSAVVASMIWLAGLSSLASAQVYMSSPRGPVGPYASPYAPGCATPGIPAGPSYGTPIPSPGTAPLPGSSTGSVPGLSTVPSPSLGAPGSDTGAGGTGAGAGAAAAAAAAAPAAAGDGAGSAGESGSSSLASAAPQMIGDIVGGGFARVSTTTITSGTTVIASSSRSVSLAARGPFKISDNESPRPQDRVFLTYNYFNNVGAGISPPGYDVNRGMAGFEKTFLDGNGSFGIRAPFQQGSGGVGGIDGFGDLSLVGKYAFYNDRQTGNVFSGGLVITVPTGTSPTLFDGRTLNATLIQPWVGGVLVAGRAYVQGFTSVVASTESVDPTLYTADIGAGYRIYQGDLDEDLITSLTPTIEGHLTTTLDNNNRNSTIYFPDLFVLTGGVHIGLGTRTYLTIGAGIPVSGPRQYDYEIIAQMNCRF